MTQDEIKKFDKRVRNIQDPFGTGFPILMQIAKETAENKGLQMFDVVREHITWKLKSL